jgi:ADP-ribose pyrophosphatase YjhB (NUDIX family)
VDWLRVVQEIQRIAQAGLAYSQNPFDLDRYSQLVKLAAEIGSAELGLPAAELEAILRAEQGYPTPKVDVRAVVPKDGKLLFVREVTDGKWALPGGWADIGSTPSEMAVREVAEETGYDVVVRRFLALQDKSKHAHPPDVWWVYKLFFLCDLVGGAPKISHETLDVAFFGPDELPPLSLPRNTEGQVRRMFAHVADPALAPDFD